MKAKPSFPNRILPPRIRTDRRPGVRAISGFSSPGAIARVVHKTKVNAGRFVAGSVLASVGLWLVWRIVDGSSIYYVHPRFTILIGVCGGMLLIGGLWLLAARRSIDLALRSNDTVSGIALLSVLALVGLVIVPGPLETNSSNLTAVSGGLSANRTFADALQKQDWQNLNTIDTTRWNALDWSAALHDPQYAEKLVGRPVDVTGFVIHPTTGGGSQFLLARYVVVCCTIDSLAMRMPVVFEAAAGLDENSWVRVRGVVGHAPDGSVAFLPASVQAVPRPAQPYINP